MFAAIDIAASGRQVKAEEAVTLGIADVVAAGDLREAALAQARAAIGKPIRRLSAESVAPFDRAEIEAAVKAVAQKARGQASPLIAAETVLLAAELPFAEGMARERAAFIRCLQSDQSRAMRYVCPPRARRRARRSSRAPRRARSKASA
jgi:3-hydroxyacyl-CoA dehydrogenase